MKPQSSRFYLSLAIAVIICGAFLIYRVTKQSPTSTTTQAQITEKTQATKATVAKKQLLLRVRPCEPRSIGKSLLKPNLILI